MVSGSFNWIVRLSSYSFHVELLFNNLPHFSKFGLLFELEIWWVFFPPPRRKFSVESPTFLPNTGLWGKLLFIWISDEITGLVWPFLNMFSWLPVGKKNQKEDLFNISNIYPRQKWLLWGRIEIFTWDSLLLKLVSRDKNSNTLTTVSFWSFKRDLNNITHCAQIFLSLKTLVVSHLSPPKFQTRSQQHGTRCSDIYPSLKTLVVSYRGRPICVFQGRCRYRLLQIK